MPPRCEVGVLNKGHAPGGHQFKCRHLMRSRTVDHHATYHLRSLGQRVCILTLLSRILIIIPLLARTKGLHYLVRGTEYTGSNKRPNREECLTIDAHRMPCRGNSGHRMPCRGTPAWICAHTGAGCRWPPGPWAARNETQTNQNGRQQSDLTLLNINRVEIWHAA